MKKQKKIIHGCLRKVILWQYLCIHRMRNVVAARWCWWWCPCFLSGRTFRFSFFLLYRSIDMATPSMSFMKKKSSYSSSFAFTSLLRHKTTKSYIAVLLFFSVAPLFTNSWFVHSEQVSVQQEDNYQVYDAEKLQLVEHDPEYVEAANIIADDKCAYLLSPCSSVSRLRIQQVVLGVKEEKMEKNDLWPSFEVGNWVYLCAETSRIYSRESRAIYYTHMIPLGPFPVIERVGVGHDSGTAGRYNYKLALPSILNLHPVFHGSMLEMENVLNKKLGLEENPGVHWIVKIPDNVVTNGCRIFRPEEVNNNIASKVHIGDSFMSIMTSIGLCITAYILLCLLCTVRRRTDP